MRLRTINFGGADGGGAGAATGTAVGIALGTALGTAFDTAFDTALGTAVAEPPLSAAGSDAGVALVGTLVVAFGDLPQADDASATQTSAAELVMRRS